MFSTEIQTNSDMPFKMTPQMRQVITPTLRITPLEKAVIAEANHNDTNSAAQLILSMLTKDGDLFSTDGIYEPFNWMLRLWPTEKLISFHEKFYTATRTEQKLKSMELKIHPYIDTILKSRKFYSNSKKINNNIYRSSFSLLLKLRSYYSKENKNENPHHKKISYEINLILKKISYAAEISKHALAFSTLYTSFLILIGANITIKNIIKKQHTEEKEHEEKIFLIINYTNIITDYLIDYANRQDIFLEQAKLNINEEKFILEKYNSPFDTIFQTALNYFSCPARFTPKIILEKNKNIIEDYLLKIKYQFSTKPLLTYLINILKKISIEIDNLDISYNEKNTIKEKIFFIFKDSFFSQKDKNFFPIFETKVTKKNIFNLELSDNQYKTDIPIYLFKEKIKNLENKLKKAFDTQPTGEKTSSLTVTETIQSSKDKTQATPKPVLAYQKAEKTKAPKENEETEEITIKKLKRHFKTFSHSTLFSQGSFAEEKKNALSIENAKEMKLIDEEGKMHVFQRIIASWGNVPTFVKTSSSLPHAKELVHEIPSMQTGSYGRCLKKLTPEEIKHYKEKTSTTHPNIEDYKLKVKCPSIKELNEIRPLLRQLDSSAIIASNSNLMNAKCCFFMMDAIYDKKHHKIEFFDSEFKLSPLHCKTASKKTSPRK